MSIMLALAACGGGQPPITRTFTSGQTVVIPAGVTNLILVSGQGAAGTPASSTTIRGYNTHDTSYNQRNDLGGQVYSTDQGTTYTQYNGATPTSYCQPKTAYTGPGGVTNYTWHCYDFSNATYVSNVSATTGASATGFGKTFPGGVGKAATPVSFPNVTVAPGSYPVVVPPGASITISYYA